MPGFRVSVALSILGPALVLSVACPAADDTQGASTSGDTVSPTGSDDSSIPGDPSDPSDPSGPSGPSDPSDPGNPSVGTEPSDDAGPASADCCSPHAGSGCEDAEVEACVCENDAVCCTFDWDALCVNAARNRCEACGGGAVDDSGSTSGDATTSMGTGSGGTTTATTTDPSGGGEACCEPTGGAAGCPGDPALEACVCALDEYCCMMEWDGLCVQQATDDCMADCEFGDGCCEVHPTTGCDNAPVETCVCAIDPFCCDEAWDDLCVSEVESERCGNC